MKNGKAWNGWLFSAVAIGLVSALTAQGAEPSTNQFSVAAYASDGLDVNSRLIIFPSDREEFSIPLPLTLRYVAYGARGQALYATAFKRLSANSGTTLPGLFKIDLSPVRVSAVPGFDGFYAIDRFAVSRKEDMILFAGARSDNGSKTCGIFQLRLPDGELRPALQTADCSAGSPWRVFDISPNTPEALISTDRHLATLDLENGKVTPLGDDLSVGSYSPDGKWIAAIELRNPSPPTTILLDRQDLSRRRDLRGSDDEVIWSPDSRFLLRTMYRPACPSKNPLALETLEIKTGKRLILKNSICNIGSSRVIGWLDSKVGR